MGRIWNAACWETGTPTGHEPKEGHIGVVNAVAWSPDGTQIVTGSTDKTARVWDVATGQTVAILEGHTDVVNAVAWSPASKQVLTGSQDGTARIWIANIQPIIAELTRRVCDVFSDEETRTEIPAWRGCTAELIAVTDDLAEYERLQPR